MSDKHLDAGLSPDERATALLAQLSLDEKMAQVSCYWPLDINATADFAERYPHGVGQVTCLEVRDARDLEEVVEFQRRVQRAAMAASGHGIPATFHMEGLCGAFLPGATSFPSGLARGSTWDPDLEGQIGSIVGRQERAVGITQTFGPVLDVSRDPRLGREGETYGEDPTLVAALGVAFTNGLQEDDGSGIRTEAVAKHFLGSHHVEGGIHGAHGDVPDRLLREVYAKPFQAAITLAGLRGVMPCYSPIGGEAVSASERLLTGLLRDEMGLDGVALSDYCAIGNLHSVQHVAESLAHAGLLALTAGMDSELQFTMAFNEELRDWFADGRADVAVLDRAVQRLLTAKFRMGLFEHPFAEPAGAASRVFSAAENRAVSLRAARESIVLLRNDGVLPLRPGLRRIAVVGPHAATARFFFGGYTHFSMSEGKLAARTSMAGLAGGDANATIERTIPGTKIQVDDDPAFEETLRQQQPGIRSLLEELVARLPDIEIAWARGYPIAGPDDSGHDEALAAAEGADLVLMTLGGKHGTSSIASMGEGIDATDINLPPCQESLIRKLAALGTPLVGVHFDGRPVSSDAADAHLNGLIEAWSPGESGAQAIVDVLLGVFNPSGRLPVSVARNSGQVPIYYNHPYGSGWHQGESIGFAEYVDAPHMPRYFFGEGLSYTAFEYSGLMLSSRSLPPHGSLEIALSVRNSGTREGTEVIQLYARDRYASTSRPVLELVGFARVDLDPGETRDVRFHLDMSQLAFVGLDMRWRVEAGECDILVGASSADIRLTDTFRIIDTQLVVGRTRAFCAAAQVGQRHGVTG